MELIVINSSKLKIMLSGDDMKKYDIDADKIDYDTTATRRAFWSILDDAKTETGFNAASDKLFIQLYPSKKGGCEMYVTKVEDSRPRTSPAKETESFYDEEHFGAHKRMEAYAFPDLEALLAVCRRLLTLGYEGESHAFRDDRRGQFFLLISRYTYGAYSYLDEYSFISEYGHAENLKQTKLYIREHATCICADRAVAQLGVL